MSLIHFLGDLINTVLVFVLLFWVEALGTRLGRLEREREFDRMRTVVRIGPKDRLCARCGRCPADFCGCGGES